MTRNLMRLVLLCALVSGCQLLRERPEKPQSLAAYMHGLEQMEPGQLQKAREMALDHYRADPNDWNRMRAAYALSRSDASQEQLSRSLEILAEIPAESTLAPMRDLLNTEVQRTQELRMSNARTRELQKRARDLEAELADVKLKLDALMQIEQKMVESREDSDELQQ